MLETALTPLPSSPTALKRKETRTWMCIDHHFPYHEILSIYSLLRWVKSASQLSGTSSWLVSLSQSFYFTKFNPFFQFNERNHVLPIQQADGKSKEDIFWR